MGAVGARQWLVAAVVLSVAAVVGASWGYAHAPRHPDQIDMVSDPDVLVPDDLTDEPVSSSPVGADARELAVVKRRVARPGAPTALVTAGASPTSSGRPSTRVPVQPRVGGRSLAAPASPVELAGTALPQPSGTLEPSGSPGVDSTPTVPSTMPTVTPTVLEGPTSPAPMPTVSTTMGDG